MALTSSRWQLYFTASAVIAVGIALDPALGVAVAFGALFAIASFLAHMRIDRLRHERGAVAEPQFPSPGT